jgi:hypothetical protein
VLAFRLGALDAGICPLNKQIPLKLRSRRTGQVNTSQGKAVNSDAISGQRLKPLPVRPLHCILGDPTSLLPAPRFHAVGQLGENLGLIRGYTTGYVFRYRPSCFDAESSRPDLTKLIRCCLLNR